MAKARKVPKPAKTNMSNETQAAKGCGRGGRAKAVTAPSASGSGRGRGRGHGRGRGRGKTNQPVESAVSITTKAKAGEKKKPVEPNTPIQEQEVAAGHSGKSSPVVITVPDDDPIYDDPPDDFSAPERSQFGRNERFRLDYSAILNESNEDNYEIETTSASTSKSAKVTDKKRTLSTKSAKNKRQRVEGSVTSLLQLSESEDGEDDSYDQSKSSDEGEDEDDEDRETEVSISRGVKNVKKDKPKALNGMENILEVCQWLITERQDILFMANQMYNALNTSMDSPLVNMPTSSPMMKSAAVTPNNEKNLARLWHEEIKCLFL